MRLLPQLRGAGPLILQRVPGSRYGRSEGAGTVSVQLAAIIENSSSERLSFRKPGIALLPRPLAVVERDTSASVSVVEASCASRAERSGLGGVGTPARRGRSYSVPLPGPLQCRRIVEISARSRLRVSRTDDGSQPLEDPNRTVPVIHRSHWLFHPFRRRLREPPGHRRELLHSPREKLWDGMGIGPVPPAKLALDPWRPVLGPLSQVPRDTPPGAGRPGAVRW